MPRLVVEIAEVGDVDLKGTGNFLGRIFGLVGDLAMGGDMVGEGDGGYLCVGQDRIDIVI